MRLLLLLVLSPFICFQAGADTVHLQEGGPVKGVVVEQYADRILFSTTEGEMILFRDKISRINFDDPEYSFLYLGLEMEKKSRWGEALSYLERALEINPNLLEARQAVLGVRSKLWAGSTDGPLSEIGKQQDMRDAWRSNMSVSDVVAGQQKTEEQNLWDRLGLRVVIQGDWAMISQVRKEAAKPGPNFKRGDTLAALDGRSLRFLKKPVVITELLEPRFANATMQIYRPAVLQKEKPDWKLKDMGFSLKQEYNGLTVRKIQKSGPGDRMGLREGDILLEINGRQTRYMSDREAIQLIEMKETRDLVLKLHRSISFTRN